MSEEQVRKIDTRLEHIKNNVRLLVGETQQMKAFASILLAAMLEPGETLRIPYEDWQQALDNPRLVWSLNRENEEDWSVYLSLEEE